MGAQAHSCLAHIQLPHAAAGLLQRDMAQAMEGAMVEMDRAGCRLIGGHSIETAEFSLGFTVNGVVEEGKLLRKSGLVPGSVLVLTKALGTGAIFAALTSDAGDARSAEAAIAMMLQSNGTAATVAREYGVQACTDVTGFGLLGHLSEMLGEERELGASLALERLPVLWGVLDLFAQGYESTLAPGNRASFGDLLTTAAGVETAPQQLLYDPQTSGGLLLAFPPERVDSALSALRAAGYADAVAIGEITRRRSGEGPVQLLVDLPRISAL